MTIAIIIITSLLLFGIVTFFVIRLINNKEKNSQPHINGEYNIKVFTTEKSKFLNKNILNSWIKELMDFWKEKRNYPLEEIENSVSDINIYIIDETVINYKLPGSNTEFKANALSYVEFRKICITSLPEPNKRIYSLFRHEMSHFIVGECEGIWNQDKSHELFRLVSLGA